MRQRWRALRVVVEIEVPQDSPLKERDLNTAVWNTLRDHEDQLNRGIEGYRTERPVHTRFRVKKWGA